MNCLNYLAAVTINACLNRLLGFSRVIFLSAYKEDYEDRKINIQKGTVFFIFSSPGRSPGRAIVLPPASLAAASALAKC